jgi:hypothetical protein
MHQEFIDGMVDTLVQSGAVPEESRELAETAMSSYWQDRIADVWSISDVKAVNPDLTDEQCRQVLDVALHGFNPDMGINNTELAMLIEVLLSGGD